ncbi:DEAD/DEAH box helicase [Cellulomonas chengniuliangii]|uniref:Helicase-related protein n=1 Tax=Cellulomonas chengniuliangii TaxID=2968084 RepID=A0ABY5KZK3_9CELL|nr:helicase-related protein [Cellulomonas chengniuliangii]MCC2309165.1 DEAD/DEAH box helicase family protein [Cellulomonas chengniuliangii]UUI75253.1 helicase-related protein [Cellulomonas chengniuliangii]
MSDQNWRWWPDGRQVVQVLAEQELFGTCTVDVYAPAEGRVHTLDAADLSDLSRRAWTSSEVSTRAITLRALSQASAGEPVAAGMHVELLPHQVSILQRALRLYPVRLAICCEVGLGKTTTAGAIVSELLARGRVGRVLVVAPKGVQLQWVAEMREKFSLDFTRIGPEGVPVDSSADVWRVFPLVVTSVDAIKPLRRRAGWSPLQVDAYNALRVEGVVSAGWDLVIIDEAHHVAGSSEDVARHQLALDLADSTPNLLLLTATPHSGKSESFRRFLGLIDPAFRSGREVSANTVATIVARTDKRGAVDHAGRVLFQPRTTRLEVVPWDDHPLHRQLYDEVTDYVREGFLQARATGDSATGFLMLLFQRLVASSTAAVLAALERRRDAIGRSSAADEPTLWDELDEEQAEALLTAPTRAADAAVLDRLIELARQTLSAESDPKTVHFLRLLRQQQRAEADPAVKVLVFTQFRATQRALVKVLEAQGIRTVTVDGTLGLNERAAAQAAFRDDAQVLVSTDAGGEGVNLQFAHVIVNLDLPWAPTLLEQRIGRVDRIGQAVPVRAFNLVLADSVDQRVLEVLEAKLDLILAELGVDKRGDVLATADQLADSLFVAAILQQDSLAAAADQFQALAQAQLAESTEARAVLSDISITVPRKPKSTLPALLERLQHVAGEPATAVLHRNSAVVPGEPVPVLRDTQGGRGWLAVGRVAGGAYGSLAGAVAVFLDDRGPKDPLRGMQLLAALPDHFDGSRALPVVPLREEQHAALLRALIDYSYQQLRQVGGGQLPLNPTVRLALVVRVES